MATMATIATTTACARAQPPGDAALCVLTNSALFESITDFMRGVPFFVLAFAKQVEPKYKPVYSRWFRQWRGVLPFMAIKEGDARVLEALYALQQREPRYRSHVKLQFHRVVLAAVKYGRLEMLRWLHAKIQLEGEASAQLAWDPGLMKEAIWHRHVHILDWLFATRPRDEVLRGAGVEHIDWAERAGTFEVVQWLHSHGYSFRTHEMDQAAEHGHFDVVQFLHRHRSEGCTTRAMDAAAEQGYLDIVRFLHEHRSEGCTTRAMDCAASRGHLAIVAFLHEHRHEGCTTSAMDAAAMNYHVDVIQYLGTHRSEGCSSSALLKVAKYGHADTVRALCEFSTRGCLFEAKQIATAWKHSQVIAVLDEFLAESVWSCSSAQHSQSGPRKCQKPEISTSTGATKKRRGRRTTAISWWLESIRGISRYYPGRDPTLLLPPSMYQTHSFRPS